MESELIYALVFVFLRMEVSRPGLDGEPHLNAMELSNSNRLLKVTKLSRNALFRFRKQFCHLIYLANDSIFKAADRITRRRVIGNIGNATLSLNGALMFLSPWGRFFSSPQLVAVFVGSSSLWACLSITIGNKFYKNTFSPFKKKQSFVPYFF